MLAAQTTNTEWWSIGLIAAYFVVLLLTRWLFVARPQARSSEAMLDGLEAEILALPGPAEGALDALGRARQLRNDQPNALLRILSWSGARDISIWRLGHSAQRLAIAGMSFEQVTARLARARAEVGELSEGSQAYWTIALRTPFKPAQDAQARATLNEFLVELFDARDVKFSNLATAQTRVVWIASVGLVLILLLTQHEYDAVFAAGAAGAVVARMRSALQERDVASDYGLSWSSLALTPVAGALSAWVGLFFIATLQDFDILSTKQLHLVTADDIRNPGASLVGLAILFGFAERLLNRVSDELQDSVTAGKSSTPASPAGAIVLAPAEAPVAPAAATGEEVEVDVEDVDEAEHYGEQSSVTGLGLGDVEAVEDTPAIDDEAEEEAADAEATGVDVPEGEPGEAPAGSEAELYGTEQAPGVNVDEVESASEGPEPAERDDEGEDPR